MTTRTLRNASVVATFSPAQIAHLRSHVLGIVVRTLPYAEEVVEGKRKWTSVQAQVWRTLVSKVMPDLNLSYAQVDVTHKNLTELSRAELEQIAAGLHEVEAAALIEASATAAKGAESQGSEQPSAETVPELCLPDVPLAPPKRRVVAPHMRDRGGRGEGRRRSPVVAALPPRSPDNSEQS
jgi:hypothetical protein